MTCECGTSSLSQGQPSTGSSADQPVDQKRPDLERLRAAWEVLCGDALSVGGGATFGQDLRAQGAVWCGRTLRAGRDITGMLVVQAFSAENREFGKFRTINKDHRKANIDAILRIPFSSPWWRLDTGHFARVDGTGGVRTWC